MKGINHQPTRSGAWAPGHQLGRLAAVAGLLGFALGNTTPLGAESIAFALIGDMPYTSPTLPDAVARYQRLITDVNNSYKKVKFTIHVGDIKAGTTRCDTSTLGVATTVRTRVPHVGLSSATRSGLTAVRSAKVPLVLRLGEQSPERPRASAVPTPAPAPAVPKRGPRLLDVV